MKLKIYAVSLMALHRIEAKAPGEDNLLYWEHSATQVSPKVGAQRVAGIEFATRVRAVN